MLVHVVFDILLLGTWQIIGEKTSCICEAPKPDLLGALAAEETARAAAMLAKFAPVPNGSPSPQPPPAAVPEPRQPQVQPVQPSPYRLVV
ncbi:hypothetical protein AK812_SmicGene22360 [Symbiodinium microadriaticum]|uniref:Uncharacterized protein n=1 Tax=Symbiodinium microadriaticum TaxID=2951 RepID=A0A1Q9DK20_SYMMI|nr:hypothetical protein AK812_SmicGene22360 [Symbiodinium microadriaticum]